MPYPNLGGRQIQGAPANTAMLTPADVDNRFQSMLRAAGVDLSKLRAVQDKSGAGAGCGGACGVGGGASGDSTRSTLFPLTVLTPGAAGSFTSAALDPQCDLPDGTALVIWDPSNVLVSIDSIKIGNQTVAIGPAAFPGPLLNINKWTNGLPCVVDFPLPAITTSQKLTLGYTVSGAGSITVLLDGAPLSAWRTDCEPADQSIFRRLFRRFTGR